MPSLARFRHHLSSFDVDPVSIYGSDIRTILLYNANHPGGLIMTAPSREATLHTRLADGSLAGNWTLDPARSTATLKSRSVWGLVPVKGTFRKIEGAGTVSPTGEVTGRIDLAADSLETKNAK